MNREYTCYIPFLYGYVLTILMATCSLLYKFFPATKKKQNITRLTFHLKNVHTLAHSAKQIIRQQPWKVNYAGKVPDKTRFKRCSLPQWRKYVPSSFYFSQFCVLHYLDVHLLQTKNKCSGTSCTITLHTNTILYLAKYSHRKITHIKVWPLNETYILCHTPTICTTKNFCENLRRQI